MPRGWAVRRAQTLNSREPSRRGTATSPSTIQKVLLGATSDGSISRTVMGKPPIGDHIAAEAGRPPERREVPRPLRAALGSETQQHLFRRGIFGASSMSARTGTAHSGLSSRTVLARR
jgi:hypothetical protein